MSGRVVVPQGVASGIAKHSNTHGQEWRCKGAGVWASTITDARLLT
jgi:hypothetical protein